MSDLSLRDIAIIFASAKTIPDSIESVLAGIEIKGTGEFSIPADTADALNNLELSTIASAFLQHGNISLPATEDQLSVVVKKPGRLWGLTNMYDKMKHYTLAMKDGAISVTLDSQVYCVPNAARIGTF